MFMYLNVPINYFSNSNYYKFVIRFDYHNNNILKRMRNLNN